MSDSNKVLATYFAENDAIKPEWKNEEEKGLFWFYDDFSFLFSKIANPVLRIVITCAAGLIAGLLLGVIVYYAQKWTICLFTAYAGAKIISGVMLPLIWSAVSSGEYVGLFEQKVIGADIGINYTLVRTLLLVAFCAAGFVIQLKTSKK